METVILATNNGIGQGDPELQQLLASKYFQLLLDDGKIPAAICFYTDGVKLTCEGSPVLDALRGLQERGTPLIVCSTCLNYYHLTPLVGIVGSMPDIIEAQWKADKVITI
jgi:hypothetical protein